MFRLAVLPAVLATWGSPHVVAPTGVPRAAVQGTDGALMLLADTGAATRFSWPPGATAPVRVALAPLAGLEPLRLNARGDALLVGETLGRLRAVALDAGGARAQLSVAPPGGRGVDWVTADLGEDGTSAVAWNEALPNLANTDTVVFVRIRPPGGEFGPVLRVPAGGLARDMELRVRADGLVELLHAGWADNVHRFFHSELRAGLGVPDPALVATTEDASPLEPVLGQGRMLFGFDPIVDVVRTGPRTWASPRRLVADAFATRSSLTTLPDGTSVLAYTNHEDVLIARAAPGQPFGAAVRIGHATRGWTLATTSVTSGRAGDLLAIWTESPLHGDVCWFDCFTRVHAAVAAPGSRFGPSSLLSGIGNVTDAGTDAVGAIGDGGARVVAWSNGMRTPGPNPLVVVLGATSGTAHPVSHRSLKVSVAVSRAALRAATRGSPLRVHVTCNQACGVRLMIYSRADPDGDGVFTMPATVRARAGTMITSWRLVPYERVALRRAVRAGRLWLPTAAEDAAGHVRYGRARLR